MYKYIWKQSESAREGEKREVRLDGVGGGGAIYRMIEGEIYAIQGRERRATRGIATKG